MKTIQTLIIITLLLFTQKTFAEDYLKDFELKYGIEEKTGKLHIEAIIPSTSTENVNNKKTLIGWSSVCLVKIVDGKKVLEVELNPSKNGSNVQINMQIASELNNKYELHITGYYGHKDILIAKKPIRVKLPGRKEVLSPPPGTSSASEYYEVIPMKEVYSKLIERDEKDLLHSGVIASDTGLSEFKSDYALNFDSSSIDFSKQKLVFGITDEITSRAFQLLKSNSYCLDYRAYAIKYKIRKAGPGEKNSFLQIFAIDSKHILRRLDVKNVIRNRKTKNYK